MDSLTSVLSMESLRVEAQAGTLYSQLIRIDSVTFMVWALGEPLTRAGQLTTGHTLTQTITLSIGGRTDDG